MATYQNMQDRIRDELQRNDLAEPIKECILDAIQHFQGEPFPVNFRTGSVALTAWTQAAYDAASAADKVYLAGLYALPGDFYSDLHVSLLESDAINPMQKITLGEMDNLDRDPSSPSTGAPTVWAYSGPNAGITGENPQEFIRVWPRPDDSSDKLQFSYRATIPAPENAGDSNFWTNEGARMVKCYAKALLFADFLVDLDGAKANEEMAQMAYNRIVRKNEARELSEQVVGAEF